MVIEWLCVGIWMDFGCVGRGFIYVFFRVFFIVVEKEWGYRFGVGDWGLGNVFFSIIIFSLEF